MPYLAAHLKDLLLMFWCSLSHYSACLNSSELFWRLERDSIATQMWKYKLVTVQFWFWKQVISKHTPKKMPLEPIRWAWNQLEQLIGHEVNGLHHEATSVILSCLLLQLDIDMINLAKLYLNRGAALCRLQCIISLIAKMPCSWKKKKIPINSKCSHSSTDHKIIRFVMLTLIYVW